MIDITNRERLKIAVDSMTLDMNNFGWVASGHSFMSYKYYKANLINVLYDIFNDKISKSKKEIIIIKSNDLVIKCDKNIATVRCRLNMDFVTNKITINATKLIAKSDRYVNNIVNLKELATMIMLQPDVPIYAKFSQVYPLFTVSITDDKLINDPVHVYVNIFKEPIDFASKLHEGLLLNLVKDIRDQNGDVNSVDYQQSDSIENIKSLINKGEALVLHAIRCSYCNHPVYADVSVNFSDMTIQATYNEEYTKRTHRLFGDVLRYGSDDTPCRDLIDDNKINFKFKCRSGKIVIANILNKLPIYIENEPSEYISINEKIGLVKMMRHWEGHNFLYMQCGNTSPNVYQMPSGEVVIGNLDDNSSKKYSHAILKGYVCTDLWAVHIVDYDDFKDCENEIDHIVLDISQLGTDITVEYNYDFADWDNPCEILLTMKGK